MINRKILRQLALLSFINIIHKVKGESQCQSNLDCSKFDTDTDSHVCIRFDGQIDFVCYLSSEAYCTSDENCQGYNEALKFCYVPPWVTNKNSQKQCFTVHKAGGSCVENIHCDTGLVCSNNICVNDTGDSKDGADATVKANSDTTSDTNSTNNMGTTTTTNNSGTKNKNKNKSSNKSSNSTNTIDLEFETDENEKEKPIEIIGLPLWAFILLISVPIVFIIAILWGLSIGRKSYKEEEERKKDKMVINNNKKDLETNFKGSSENLLPQSTSDLSLKDDMLKNYIKSENRKKSRDAVPSTVSSNSTIANNLTTVTVEGNKDNLEVPKPSKPRKSNASANSDVVIPPKPKKPKSLVNSEFSDTNSHKGLLTAGQPMGVSATDSGIYSNYFGNGSTVSSSYFGQPMAPADPTMTALYYQQYMAAQAQQAAVAQQYMNQYYIDNGMGVPTMDMMQYQQMYGMGLNGAMAYPAGETVSTPTEEKKRKQSKK